MKIEVEIDDNELRERVADMVAKQLASDLFDRYTAERHQFAKVMDKAIKNVLLDKKAEIVERAIEKAAGKIAYGAAPKLVEKLTTDASHE